MSGETGCTPDPAPLRQALCWAHSRRKFFVLADIATNAKRGSKAAPISPMALEAVKRIDALFDIEREINGLAAQQLLEHRCKNSLPLVEELHDWLQNERAKQSRSSPVAEAADYMLKRWKAGAIASVELDTQNVKRSSGLTCGLRRMLTSGAAGRHGGC